MTEHEVLVVARNGIDHIGWDFGVYGPDDKRECGSPRCALGWVGHGAGMTVFPGQGWGSILRAEDAPEIYRQALVSLWTVRPGDLPLRYAQGNALASAVEGVARAIDMQDGVSGILAWFDRAIAATAPPPADPFDGTVLGLEPKPEAFGREPVSALLEEPKEAV